MKTRLEELLAEISRLREDPTAIQKLISDLCIKAAEGMPHTPRTALREDNDLEGIRAYIYKKIKPCSFNLKSEGSFFKLLDRIHEDLIHIRDSVCSTAELEEYQGVLKEIKDRRRIINDYEDKIRALSDECERKKRELIDSYNQKLEEAREKHEKDLYDTQTTYEADGKKLEEDLKHTNEHYHLILDDITNQLNDALRARDELIQQLEDKSNCQELTKTLNKELEESKLQLANTHQRWRETADDLRKAYLAGSKMKNDYISAISILSGIVGSLSGAMNNALAISESYSKLRDHEEGLRFNLARIYGMITGRTSDALFKDILRSMKTGGYRDQDFTHYKDAYKNAWPRLRNHQRDRGILDINTLKPFTTGQESGFNTSQGNRALSEARSFTDIPDKYSYEVDLVDAPIVPEYPLPAADAKELAKAKEEAQACQAELDKLNAQLLELLRTKDALDTELNSTKETLGKTQKVLYDTTKTLNDRSKELEETKKDLANRSAELSAEIVKYNSANEQLGRCETQLRTTQEYLTLAQNQVQEKTTEIETLNTQLTNKEAEFNKYKTATTQLLADFNPIDMAQLIDDFFMFGEDQNYRWHGYLGNKVNNNWLTYQEVYDMNKKEIIQRAFFFRDHIIANKQARKAIKLIGNKPLLTRHNQIISDPYGGYIKDTDADANPGLREIFKVLNLKTKNNLFYHDKDERANINTDKDPGKLNLNSAAVNAAYDAERAFKRTKANIQSTINYLTGAEGGAVDIDANTTRLLNELDQTKDALQKAQAQIANTNALIEQRRQEMRKERDRYWQDIRTKDRKNGDAEERRMRNEFETQLAEERNKAYVSMKKASDYDTLKRRTDTLSNTVTNQLEEIRRLKERLAEYERGY